MFGFARYAAFCYTFFMNYYPAFIDSGYLSCLVVGAGKTGFRKIKKLLECGVKDIRIVEPRPSTKELNVLLKAYAGAEGSLCFIERQFAPLDLDDRTAVFACTNFKGVNASIARLAHRRGQLVNVVDSPDLSSFIVPGMVLRGPLHIAFSTSGASPALAKKIRKEMEECFGREYELFLTLMQRIRVLVFELGQPTEENTLLFRQLAASALMAHLKKKDTAACKEELRALLPMQLHVHIEELLNALY